MSAKISLRLTTLVVFTTLVFTLLGWILPEFLRFIQYPLLGIFVSHNRFTTWSYRLFII
jgi:hypothetical protein